MDHKEDKNAGNPSSPADSLSGSLPDSEEEDMFVTLNMDDGTTVESRILTIFDTGTQDYIALLPLDENGNDNEEGIVYLYRYFEDKDGNPSIENIEDDSEYEAAANSFDELQDESEHD